jgi:thiamine biosynthesis protein ThiS
MTIQLNGEPREIPDGLTLTSLVEWLKLAADRVAVERNLKMVPRELWSKTSIQTGDRLEVVHFVGGGSRGSMGGSLGSRGPRRVCRIECLTRLEFVRAEVSPA